MFWKRVEEDDNQDDIREGMAIMPAIIGILLVLVVGFQLFYRYDSWPSKTRDGVMYERDRLTGELHVVYPGDKVSLIDRVTGHYGHSAEDMGEDGHSPLVSEAHKQSDALGENISEHSYRPSASLEASAQASNDTQSPPYYSQPYPQQASNYQQPNYPPQQPVQVYYQQPPAQQSQPVVYPVPQPVIVTIPANAYNAPTPEPRTPEAKPAVAFIDAQRRTPQPAKAAPPQAAVAATQKAITEKPLATPGKVIAKVSQGQAIPSQLKTAANAEVQLRTEHQAVMIPIRGGTANPKPAFAPLVPQTASAPARKIAAAPAKQGTSSQALDLNRDGSDEHIIQTPRADGHINISVVSEGKEILFGQGQQLQILPSRKQGWSDLALMNTKTGQRHVYQFDPRTQGYAKAYMEPLHPVVAQRTP